MAHQQPHLPSDACWELVFQHLPDPLDHESLSFVSHGFRTLTNRIRTHLTVSDREYPGLATLLPRFNNLTSIGVKRFTGNIDQLLSEIATYNLPSLHSLSLSHQPTFPAIGLQALFQSFGTLKSFICLFEPQGLGLLVDYFQNIESISFFFLEHPIPDEDFKALALRLKKLRKVKTLGDRLQDSSIFTLCKNCKFLEELKILGNGLLLSQIGIADAICQRPQLRSLALPTLHSKRRYDVTLELIDALLTLKNLNSLVLLYWDISDQTLKIFAEKGISLRKLKLQNCNGFGFDGIYCFLRNCNNLHCLKLVYAKCLTDENVIKLSSVLPHLNTVDVSWNDKLTELSFIAIMRNCQKITKIKMQATSIGRLGLGEDSEMVLLQKRLDGLKKDLEVVKSQVKFIDLAINKWLNDEVLSMIALFCPELEMMNLRSCSSIEEGVIQVMRECKKIRDINLASIMAWYMDAEVSFRFNFDVPTLFVLDLSNNVIKDDDLHCISTNCFNLKVLLLVTCSEITTRGVKRAVTNCTTLRRIELSNCYGVSPKIVTWMVETRPSLRFIQPPPRFRPTEDQKNLFRQKGCFVGEVSDDEDD